MNNSKPQKSHSKRSLQTPPQAISKAPPYSSEPLAQSLQKPLTKYPENSQKSPLCHPFEPIIFSDSKILILGSFPSVASRQESFYYAHKQNRFWKILEGLFDSPLHNQPKECKIAFLKSTGKKPLSSTANFSIIKILRILSHSHTFPCPQVAPQMPNTLCLYCLENGARFSLILRLSP